MGFFSKDIKTLDDLFVHTLRDIYYAEKQIEQGAAGHDRQGDEPALKQASRSICRRPRATSSASRKCSRCTASRPRRVNCPAIDGIIEEADEITGDIDDPQVLDAALIAAAQAVEHYEITRYGTLIAWAKRAWPQRLRRRAQARTSTRRRPPTRS